MGYYAMPLSNSTDTYTCSLKIQVACSQKDTQTHDKQKTGAGFINKARGKGGGVEVKS